MRNIAAFTVAFILSVVCALDAQATEPFAKVGIYGMQFLHLPVGVRNIGMGATGTSDVSGSGTGYFNPAAVAFADATTLLGGYQDIGPADLDLSDVIITTPVPFQSDDVSGEWGFAGSIGYTRLSMDPQVDRTIFLPEGTGRTFDAEDWMLSAVGATSWSRGPVTLAGGATGKYIHSGMSAGSAEALALDLGAIASFPIDLGGGLVRPRLGYALLNLDTGPSYDGRDAVIANEQRGGFGFDVTTPPVTMWSMGVPLVALSLDYDRINREANSNLEYAAGFEISLVSLMHFRYGTTNSDLDTYGFGIGWDYGQVLFSLDYAHQENDASFLEIDRDTVGAMIGVRW
jgi:hypothetical protein